MWLHPADETYRVPGLFRRRSRGLRLVRRSDHAAGNGGGGFCDRRVSQSALSASGRCRHISGPDLFFFNLCNGSFRGAQAQSVDDPGSRAPQLQGRSQAGWSPVSFYRHHHCPADYRLHPHVCRLLGHHLDPRIEFSASGNPHESRRYTQCPRRRSPDGGSRFRRLRRSGGHHRLCVRIRPGS